MKRGSLKFEPLPPEPPDPNSGNNGVILYCTTVQHETVMVENFSRYESSQSNCQSFIHQQCYPGWYAVQSSHFVNVLFAKMFLGSIPSKFHAIR